LSLSASILVAVQPREQELAMKSHLFWRTATTAVAVLLGVSLSPSASAGPTGYTHNTWAPGNIDGWMLGGLQGSAWSISVTLSNVSGLSGFVAGGGVETSPTYTPLTGNTFVFTATSVTAGGMTTALSPFMDDLTDTRFFNYSSTNNEQLPVAAPTAQGMFYLHEDVLGLSQVFSLGVVFNGPAGGGSADTQLTGLPPTALFSAEDDPQGCCGDTYTIVEAPEPGSLSLLGVGLVGVYAARRRIRRPRLAAA
jgi:hypothetical protein